MRYFVAVAQRESVNRAAGEIHVSPGSLSKAIARLEAELGAPLFFKVGRGIRLTPEGQLLKARAIQILQMEEDARLELMGKEAGSVNLYVSSEEILQSSFGPQIGRRVQSLFPLARTHFLIRDEVRSLEQVQDGEVHLALSTQEAPKDLQSKVIARVEFKTCAGSSHPLVKKYGAKSSIPVAEVLKHGFVVPEAAILGRVVKSVSVDGWRDDKFPRIVKYKVCGLKLMENLIHDGLALGYLPDHFVEQSELLPLKITGCPYTCEQVVRVVAKEPSRLGWLSRLWDQF